MLTLNNVDPRRRGPAADSLAANLSAAIALVNFLPVIRYVKSIKPTMVR